MAIVQILGNADLPSSSGYSTLIAQPATPLPSITGLYPPLNAADPNSVVGTGKYLDTVPPTDPCARIAYYQAKGVRLTPEQATALTTACRNVRGIAPQQPARYQPQTGEVSALDATTGQMVTVDGQTIDPVTGLPIEPWYMNKTYWLIGGAALVGAYLLLK